MPHERRVRKLGLAGWRVVLWPLFGGLVLGGLVSGRAFAQDGPGFENGAADRGLESVHVSGASPEKYLPETMGGGGLFLDFDNDGWLDILLVNGGEWTETDRAAPHRLFRNLGGGDFEDVTARSGITPSGHGMGACAADVDNDGDVDVYVSSFGPDRLYRNVGQGRFEDATETAGIDAPLWSASCAFADIDNDGDVDLYVTSYVDFTVESNRVCTVAEGLRVYCHPNVYNGVPDLLYVNNGDGTFVDRTEEAGIGGYAGKGLGVVFGDYDDDGWTDIYVANDSVPNFMFHNKGDGTFEEVALFVQVAVDSNGRPLAGMGTDMGDLDGDGLDDLFVTNLDRQMHTVYTNLGRGMFMDTTLSNGAGAATLPYVGFGTAFVDYDNDRDLDIAIANGHVIDNVAEAVRSTDSHAQRNLLLRNDGQGAFTDATDSAGEGWALEKVSRALAAGDIDNDGDMDFLVVNNGGAVDLLVNDGAATGNALLVRLVGTESNRDGIGTELLLRLGNDTLVRHVKAGSSYLAQNDLRVHFGLGSSQHVDALEIRWPGGHIDVIDGLDANRMVTVVEGEGVTADVPLERRQ